MRGNSYSILFQSAFSPYSQTASLQCVHTVDLDTGKASGGDSGLQKPVAIHERLSFKSRAQT